MTMTFADIEQVDPVLSEDGRSVCFFGHTPDEDQTFFWSIGLPMMVEEDVFENLLPEWREVGWQMVMQQA
ncbi:hypothetical protein [Rhizobium ruizarguesonis]|uniref:Uncharacterized protein n=1 Tax=Rhizobium ruizarguesonis TaxID=2081791 RepID=A0AAE8QBN3_9HYPH|nr:hypothetical protein [Rhizobium ruizarguesonis]TBE49312.1 hypothetical protein ELH06_09135 [Rhizobium ruizarguesonis]TBF18455.1 hypothetical protein ELG94_08820 [Rhizobium ruizarguesonis]WSH22772.1 hypothetical protein U8Q07_10790 [Rhizobium ruizarguesonis]